MFEIDKFLPGGSTYPLGIIAVDKEGNANQYIAKCYTQKNIKENFSVGKEILISEVAKLFDLNVPKYGIIEISKDVLAQHYPEKYLPLIDDGLKFCSRRADTAYLLFSRSISLGFLRDYDVENIFAFDALVHNVDRGGPHHKPNLLINDKDLLLIDHELTLPFINGHPSTVNYYNYLRIYNFNSHVLYPHLKAVRDKSYMFDEFAEMLKNVNFNSLAVIFDEMDYYNISYGNREDILDYFAWAKQNVSFIRNTLRQMIR